MRTRLCLVVAVLTVLGGCSSGSAELAAPEPPPASALAGPEAPEPGPSAPLAAAPVVEVAAPVAPEPPASAGPAAAAAVEDDPVLEGTARPAAPVRPAPAAATAAPGVVHAASARPSGKPVPTGRIEIPAIGLNHLTYEGIDLATINYGPSHWPGTPLPGQRGNTVFPGHRTTYSRPFWDIDKLAVGHEVIFTTPAGRFTYRVTQTLIVGSRDTWVVNPTPEATFTIMACHPKGSARQRIVVKGTLVAAPPPPRPQPTTTTRPRRGLLGLF